MKPLSLFWHSVEPDSISSEYLDGRNSTASIFREQVKFLMSRLTPVSVIDFIELVTNKKSPRAYDKPPVLLGFDDGFKNVITEALPVLNEFHIPAVFFVVGEALNNPDFVPWFVEVRQLLRRTKNRNIVYTGRQLDLTSPQDHFKLENLVEAAFSKCRSDDDRDRLLTEFASRLDVNRARASNLDDDLCLVSKADLEKLTTSSLLTVASHGMTHRHLASLSRAEQARELEESHLLLRRYCPSYYPVLSYPGGSFTGDTLVIAREIYKAAFGVFLGSSCGNLYAYPRTGIDYCSLEELAYCINRTRVNYILPFKRFLHHAGLGRVATAKSLRDLRRSISFFHH